MKSMKSGKTFYQIRVSFSIHAFFHSDMTLLVFHLISLFLLENGWWKQQFYAGFEILLKFPFYRQYSLINCVIDIQLYYLYNCSCHPFSTEGWGGTWSSCSKLWEGFTIRVWLMELYNKTIGQSLEIIHGSC